MPGSPEEPPDEEPAATRAVDRAAALDDLIGCFDPPTGNPARDLDDATAAGATGLLDTMLLLRQAAAADGVVPHATPVPAPHAIGRYAILRRAGEGGFATVWEAFDPELQRTVALKVRRPEALFSGGVRRRFARDAEIAARLVHPHIVRIFEVGDDRGCEFVAAEFCSGGNLASWLERRPGPLPPAVAARLVRTLAAAVAHAHHLGIVHGDITPTNVLLVPVPADREPLLPDVPGPEAGGPGLTVKLGDFGAGLLQEDGVPIIGTPGWMAPEQIDRALGPVGVATDVHALGLLLHRLLTGRVLAGGDATLTASKRGLPDDGGPVDRDVPRDLAAVCSRCVAERPADRYPSAAALAEELDRWLAGRTP